MPRDALKSLWCPASTPKEKKAVARRNRIRANLENDATYAKKCYSARNKFFPMEENDLVDLCELGCSFRQGHGPLFLNLQAFNSVSKVGLLAEEMQVPNRDWDDGAAGSCAEQYVAEYADSR